tara:strand:- start:1469 stop:2059 length:591 start_codon:yes stop_codon:yes gene_type:complete
MALSTSITVVTRSGLSTHDHYDVRNLFSVGVATFSNFKTGTTNVHNIGIEVSGINVLGADTPIGSGSTIYDDGGVRFSGIVTATAFHGSGANLTGIDATSIKNGNDVKVQANSHGVVITGVATATSFVGSGTNLTGVSGPEVYGFTGIGSNLQVTTTNGGNDSISSAQYAAFEDVLFAPSGMTFSINSSGNLIATF